MLNKLLTLTTVPGPWTDFMSVPTGVLWKMPYEECIFLFCQTTCTGGLIYLTRYSGQHDLCKERFTLKNYAVSIYRLRLVFSLLYSFHIFFWPLNSQDTLGYGTLITTHYGIWSFHRMSLRYCWYDDFLNSRKFLWYGKYVLKSVPPFKLVLHCQNCLK
jgi:hypothetical protein